MKIELISKLNFRDTHDNFTVLTINSEYILESLLMKLIPGCTFNIVDFRNESDVNQYPSYYVHNNTDDIDKDRNKYVINGVIGTVNIDLPARYLYSTDVLNDVRSIIKKLDIDYIDVRAD